MLLRGLAQGLGPAMDEEARYQTAEMLAAAVYPKFKFSEFARIYLEDEDFIAYYERIMDTGNWHSLDRKYTLDQMLKLVGHLAGDIVECGCYKGASAYLMCRALRGTNALVHLFDSFEGLSSPDSRDGDYWVRGALAVTEDSVHETLKEFDNYRVYKGWIPGRFPEMRVQPVRFLHIDVDLYGPTYDSLTFFYSRLERGAMVLFDDYGFSTCPGAKEAADEFFADKPERIAMLPTGQAFAIKL